MHDPDDSKRRALAFTPAIVNSSHHLFERRVGKPFLVPGLILARQQRARVAIVRGGGRARAGGEAVRAVLIARKVLLGPRLGRRPRAAVLDRQLVLAAHDAEEACRAFEMRMGTGGMASQDETG